MAKASSSSNRNSPHSAPKQSKQTGGTFLGLVLGLIVGLAIAVVVALYITRTPTPFVAKVAPAPASDAQAANDAQFDPNRALQGKAPGQPVPQAAQPAPPNTAPGQSDNRAQQSGMLDEPQIIQVPPAGANNGVAIAPQPSTGNSNAAQAQKPQPAVSAPTTTARAEPHSSAPAAAPAVGAANNEPNAGYFLQVGAYKTQSDAEQQRARLAFQGFESKVSQRDAGGVTYFRVRIGPFSKFDDMNSARQRLSDAGVDTAVIRFTKQ